MKRLTFHFEPNDFRLWYNDWVEKNAKGKVLDVGKSIHWEYGFDTIDNNPELNPTILGDICHCELQNDTYDTVLCNGMYECVKDDPQLMIDEVLRILKYGGIAIFGFVGKEYPPHKEEWRYFDDKEDFRGKEISRVDFRNEYHFIICKK